jgi:hypothetical protein
MRSKRARSDRVQAIEAVRAAVEAVEARGGGACGAGAGGESAGAVLTGWGPVDAAGGLARGAAHEWLSGEGEEWRRGRRADLGGMGVAIHLARCAAEGAAVWIGRRCWPPGRALVAGGGVAEGAFSLLERSLFVDAPDRASRVWAIDLALRSSAVGAVVADGSGLDMASTRRLQLAARASGGGGFCLLLRPGSERRALSAAQTRWVVRPALTDGRRARWMIELVRRKGAVGQASSLPGARGAPLLLEWDHEAGAVVVAPEVVGGRVAQELRHAG